MRQREHIEQHNDFPIMRLAGIIPLVLPESPRFKMAYLSLEQEPRVVLIPSGFGDTNDTSPHFLNPGSGLAGVYAFSGDAGVVAVASPSGELAFWRTDRVSRTFLRPFSDSGMCFGFSLKAQQALSGCDDFR